MVHLLIVLFVCLSWPAFAQDVNSLDGSVAVSEEAVKDADSLYKNMQAIAADLSEANKKHFFAI